jgi:NADH dehydrogenase
LRQHRAQESHVRTLLADVTDIDVDARSCTPTARQPSARAAYDTLIVAAGATHSYFGNNQLRRVRPGMKTVEDARYLRDGILPSSRWPRSSPIRRSAPSG